MVKKPTTEQLQQSIHVICKVIGQIPCFHLYEYYVAHRFSTTESEIALRAVTHNAALDSALISLRCFNEFFNSDRKKSPRSPYKSSTASSGITMTSPNDIMLRCSRRRSPHQKISQQPFSPCGECAPEIRQRQSALFTRRARARRGRSAVKPQCLAYKDRCAKLCAWHKSNSARTAGARSSRKISRLPTSRASPRRRRISGANPNPKPGTEAKNYCRL